MHIATGEPTVSRRRLASRSTAWAQWMAARLAESGITPNQISSLSLFWAAAGGAAVLWGSWPAMVAAAACIQMRLLCNLMDGMVAIEWRKASPTGVLYNEVPDRIADCLLLVPLGYAIGLPAVGWLLGLLALATAYVRLLGGSLGLPQDFGGIMPKQRRMAALTCGLLAGALEQSALGSQYALVATASAIGVGSALTCGTRLSALSSALELR